jgi:N-acetylneuraminic acid mutarotase
MKRYFSLVPELKKLIKFVRYISLTFVIAFGFAAIISSCGGGGDGGGNQSGSAPVISNLSYSPTSAKVGGSGLITGSIDFLDNNDNVSSLTITIFDANDKQLGTTTNPLTAVSGIKSGRMNVEAQIDTSVEGVYTFDISITDTTNLTSNVLVGNFTVSENPWMTKTDMPVAFGDMGAANFNGKIYIIGGLADFSDSGNLNQTLTYDTSNDAWETNASMPTGRFRLTAGAVNGKIYAIGGCNVSNGTRQELDTVEEYDPANDTWTAKTPMPTARDGLASGVVNGKIYIIGGIVSGEDFGSSIISDAAEEYDPATDIWTIKAPMPTARSFHAAAVVDGKIYVLGGNTEPNFFNHVDIVEEYDPATDVWTTKAPMPTARSFLAAAVIDGKIYALGGDGGNTVVEEYDPATDTWTTKTPMPTGKNDFAASAENNKIYVMGGLFNSSVLEYDPSNDQ